MEINLSGNAILYLYVFGINSREKRCLSVYYGKRIFQEIVFCKLQLPKCKLDTRCVLFHSRGASKKTVQELIKSGMERQACIALQIVPESLGKGK